MRLSILITTAAMFVAPAVAPAAESVSVTAPPGATAPGTTFDELKALFDPQPPAPPREMGLAKYYAWIDEKLRAANAAGLEYFNSHPDDPRRWDIVILMVNRAPIFAQGFGSDVETKGLAAATIDQAAKTAWEQKAVELRRALLASTDAAPAAREAAAWYFFAMDFRATSAALRSGQTVDWAPFWTRFQDHVRTYASLDAVAGRADDYLGALERNVPGSTLAHWRSLLDAPNAALRDRAAAHVRVAELATKPIEMSFTAADGRSVDLASLRGKVVLVDFWATWCGPCIAELPNLKRVFDAYHDKGFEVVGVSFENARLAPTDAPDVVSRKKAAAREKMLQFTREHGMTWPQHFDGEFWNNEFGRRYNIRSIPAMFLLDKDGKLVDTNARGEKLEPAVKKLLGL